MTTPKKKDNSSNKGTARKNKMWIDDRPLTLRERLLQWEGSLFLLGIYIIFSDSWYWLIIPMVILLACVISVPSKVQPPAAGTTLEPTLATQVYQHESTSTPPETKYNEHLNVLQSWPAEEQPKRFPSTGMHTLTKAQWVGDRNKLSWPSAADLSATFQFMYKIIKGASSKRRLLLCGRIEQHSTQYLNGVSLNSNQTCTFRVGRIESTLTQLNTRDTFSSSDVNLALKASGKTKREAYAIGIDRERSTPPSRDRKWLTPVYFAVFYGSKNEVRERIAINVGLRFLAPLTMFLQTAKRAQSNRQTIQK